MLTLVSSRDAALKEVGEHLPVQSAYAGGEGLTQRSVV